MERFAGAGGNVCEPAGRVRYGVIGWAGPDEDNPTCHYDTRATGASTGLLGMYWQAHVPADGDYAVVARAVNFGTFGQLSAAGSWVPGSKGSVSFWLHQRVLSPRCGAEKLTLLGSATSYAPASKSTRVDHWITLPTLVARGCRGGDVLEAHLELRAVPSNRWGGNSRVSVEWAGILATADDQKNQLFELAQYVSPPPKPRCEPPTRNCGARRCCGRLIGSCCEGDCAGPTGDCN